MDRLVKVLKVTTTGRGRRMRGGGSEWLVESFDEIVRVLREGGTKVKVDETTDVRIGERVVRVRVGWIGY